MDKKVNYGIIIVLGILTGFVLGMTLELVFNFNLLNFIKDNIIYIIIFIFIYLLLKEYLFILKAIKTLSINQDYMFRRILESNMGMSKRIRELEESNERKAKIQEGMTRSIKKLEEKVEVE